MVFQEKTYSVLIVSASDSFTNSVMPLLPMTDYWPVSTVGSVGQARRRLTDTEFDIVLINTPLPDDFGMQLAIDICSASGAGVLLLVKNDHYNDVYAKVVGYGVHRPVQAHQPADGGPESADFVRHQGANAPDAGKAGHRGGED